MSFTCDQLVCYYCRHFTLIILTNLTFGIYTAVDLNVTVFSVTKSQFNKQSVELSILQTLSKYFTNPKFVFMFDLVSSLVEYNEEENIGKKLFVCLFLAFLQANYKNSTSAKTHEILFVWLYGTGGTADKIELCLRYLGQDWNLSAVPAVP